MTFEKKAKLSLLAAVIGAFLGSGIILFLTPAFRSVALTLLITCAVVFIVVLVLAYALEGKSKKLRTPVFVAVVIVSLLAVSCIALYNYGKLMTFHPYFDEDSYDELSDMSNKVYEISEDGLCGWRLPAASETGDTPRPVILYFGGNGENSSTKILHIMEESDLFFLHDDYDFIFIDYPSYGLSEGSISEDAMREFALKAYDIVTSLDTTSSVSLLSYSIGNGPAVYLASQPNVEIENMVLLAPYYSGCDLYNNYLNIFHGPLVLLAAYRMPVYKYAGNVTCPVTVIASQDDEVIPIESSRHLFTELTESSASFITVQGVEHNDFFSTDEVVDAVRNAFGG